MTPTLWIIFALVAVWSVLMIAVAVVTTPRKDVDR